MAGETFRAGSPLKTFFGSFLTVPGPARMCWKYKYAFNEAYIEMRCYFTRRASHMCNFGQKFPKIRMWVNTVLMLVKKHRCERVSQSWYSNIYLRICAGAKKVLYGHTCSQVGD